MLDFLASEFIRLYSLAEGHWRPVKLLGRGVRRSFPLPPELAAAIFSTEDLIDPSPLGFGATLIYIICIYIFGAFCFAATWTRCPSAGSCRICVESVCELSVLYSCFWFSPDRHSGLRPRRSVHLDVHLKWFARNSEDTGRDKKQPTERRVFAHFSCGQLELSTFAITTHGIE